VREQCSDGSCTRGDAVGNVDMPGVGNLCDIINNLEAILDWFETNMGAEATGLLGPRIKLVGMSQLKKIVSQFKSVRVRPPLA
jgi:hypothetical protein